MQYFFLIIFLGILSYDLRKGVLIYAPFKLFFLSSIKLVGPLSFDAVLSIIIVIAYMFRYYKHLKTIRKPWIFGIFIGVLFAVINGLFPVLYGSVLWSIFTVFLYTIVYFDSINSITNLKVALNSIILFGIIMCVNGFYEYFAGNNYLRDIQQSIAIKDAYFSENAIERFGITHRVCSCLPHAIGYGTVCVSFLYIIIYIIYKTKYELNLIIATIILLLLSSGIILSASRSPLLGLIVMALPFVISKDTIKLRNLLLLCLMVSVAVYYAGDFLLQMFLSMISEDKAIEARGSGYEIRQNQFNLTMLIWSRNPLLGYGGTALEEIDRTGMLRGAESLWFQVLIRRGIIGFIGYILFYFFVFLDIFQTQKERFYKLSFWSGWIIINTVTSLPGLTDFLALMVLSLMYKLEHFDLLRTKNTNERNLKKLCLLKMYLKKNT